MLFRSLGDEGAGISYAEFSYALIQGYDFVHLHRTYNVTLQLCGADQWGNSLAGVDLIRRMDGQEAHVYSMPLIINKATGAISSLYDKELNQELADGQNSYNLGQTVRETSAKRET